LSLAFFKRQRHFAGGIVIALSATEPRPRHVKGQPSLVVPERQNCERPEERIRRRNGGPALERPRRSSAPGIGKVSGEMQNHWLTDREILTVNCSSLEPLRSIRGSAYLNLRHRPLRRGLRTDSRRSRRGADKRDENKRASNS
jgi:hypothetical protein